FLHRLLSPQASAGHAAVIATPRRGTLNVHRHLDWPSPAKGIFGCVSIVGDNRFLSTGQPLSEADDDPADPLPEIPAGPPLSRLGNLWILGPHRVLCSSALHRQALAMLLGDEHAAMVFTDPRYNMPIGGHA